MINLDNPTNSNNFKLNLAIEEIRKLYVESFHGIDWWYIKPDLKESVNILTEALGNVIELSNKRLKELEEE